MSHLPHSPHGSADEPAAQTPFGTLNEPRQVTPEEWGLLDAESQHDAFPDAFPIPTPAERHNLHAGDMVKLVFVRFAPATAS